MLFISDVNLDFFGKKRKKKKVLDLDELKENLPVSYSY